MVFICVFKYESTPLLGVSFLEIAPLKNPAPGVTCLLFSKFPDNSDLQAQLIEYLNSAFSSNSGNSQNLFNVKVESIEKLIVMLTSTSFQKDINQTTYMPVGYIVPRPTRNDDSEFSRTPVSSFSYANHHAAIPMMRLRSSN